MDDTVMIRCGLATLFVCVSTCSLACASGSTTGDTPDGSAAPDSTSPESSSDDAGDALGDAMFDSTVAPADDGGSESSASDDAGEGGSDGGVGGDSGSEAGAMDSSLSPDTGTQDASHAEAGPSLNGGTYHLVNAATGFVADVYNQSTSSGVEVIQYHANGGSNQQWTFVISTGGAYQLFNKNSNLLLDTTGTSVIQATPSGGASQRWVVAPGSSAGFYVLTSGGGMGALSAQGSSEGAQLLVQPPNGTTTQEWQLTP